MLLEGKTMVVTGGNSGIGAAICVAAAAEGANIVIDYVAHPEDTTSLLKKIEDAGGHAVGIDADVSTPPGPAAGAARTGGSPRRGLPGPVSCVGANGAVWRR